MEPLSHYANTLFDAIIKQYHIQDSVEQQFKSSYPSGSLPFLLEQKCWIDTVQWHYEDLIRDPSIAPQKGMELKRKIDASNQERTDMVEFIDSYYLNHFREVVPKPSATHNSESPAWAIDRLSILALKIYHMKEEAERPDTTADHQKRCHEKLQILLQQRKDLSEAIDALLTAISKGQKVMKVYKQMKMYNDDTLNPVLYSKQKNEPQ